MQLEKVTSRAGSETKRVYDDACGTAHGLELVGDRWTLLIMRELIYGPRRFSDLRRDLAGISANVLSQRLEELERRGLLAKVRLPPPAARDAYQATDWGLEVKTVIMELGRFAARSPGHDPTLPLSPASIMMSFETMIDEKKARGFEARVGFVLNGEPFTARVRKGRVRVVRGLSDERAALVTAPPESVAAVVYGGAPAEMLGIAGDEAVARRFLTLFTLPPKADTRAS
ncbi:winged helix-turn-helix transcriptional regulator [Sphingomonas astaxanthinifaciens]|uniref:winged helix-turn-helix transcriptional regulator n=1 Tax=Sphingomonas astaxanthinifaciens TaxID=407019 RepID=UPI0004A73B82|nr:helix-turn-helix domain-containing protein [Sphingomonas astaxanthinifaciens]